MLISSGVGIAIIEGGGRGACDGNTGDGLRGCGGLVTDNRLAAGDSTATLVCLVHLSVLY